MAHVSPILLFITCLQLSRELLAEGTWYSANVINDGDFSPKPISEIFSTEPPPSFSTKNPIVVLQQGNTSPGQSTASLYDPNGITSYSTGAPQQYGSTAPSTFATQTSFFDTQSPRPGSTEPDPFPFQIIEQDNGLPIIRQTGKPGVPPNYFVIYQQSQQQQQQDFTSPQTTFSTPQTTFSSPQTTFSTPQPTFSTPRPEISSPQTTFSTFQPDISSFPSTFTTMAPDTSSPFTLSSLSPEISTLSSTFSTLRPDMTSRFTVTPGPTDVTSPQTFSSGSTLSSFQPSSFSPTPPMRSTFAPGVQQTTRNQPCRNATNRLPLGTNYPTLRIRMVAPSGSITNIHLNQPTSSTTRRTTTRRPTTTRTRKTKRNRNSYDGCINACSGRKAPICAAPLAAVPIDPNSLKGFPSICHMACFNSFRKLQYEMLVDGRCGRLRNRIRPLNSNNKLNRLELNKAQYTIVNDPQTIVEFSNLPN